MTDPRTQIVEVCVGMPKPVQHGNKEVITGIFKSPIAGEIKAGWLHLDDDGQADLTVHGGRDKALYAYPFEHYDTWATELGVAQLEPSQFGENLTVSGLTEERVMIGDRYRFGNVTAIVAQPRLPCFKLGIRLADDTFPSRFLKSGRLGFYLRVEQQGTVQRGDAIELLQRPEHGISVRSLWKTVFGNDRSASDAQWAIDSLPYLDDGWRRRLQRIVDHQKPG